MEAFQSCCSKQKPPPPARLPRCNMSPQHLRDVFGASRILSLPKTTHGGAGKGQTRKGSELELTQSLCPNYLEFRWGLHGPHSVTCSNAASPALSLILLGPGTWTWNGVSSVSSLERTAIARPSGLVRRPRTAGVQPRTVCPSRACWAWTLGGSPGP